VWRNCEYKRYLLQLVGALIHYRQQKTSQRCLSSTLPSFTMSNRDPFYSVKDKVSVLLTQLRSDFSRFDSLSTRSADYKSMLGQLRQQVSAVDTDCKDLAQTIVIVEQNRSRFPSISDAELSSRKQFVSSTLQTLSTYTDSLKRAQQKLNKDNRQDLIPSSSSRFTGASTQQVNREQDDYVSSAAQQQQQLIKQQDVVLEDMDAALARLGNISNDINAELVEQDVMLNEMDSQMDEAQGNMGIVLKKMDKLLKTSDKGRICCIIGLFFLAVLLLILIFYT